jgi:hypothetical protein
VTREAEGNVPDHPGSGLPPGWTRCVCGQPVINSYNGWTEHTPWCPLRDGLSVPVKPLEVTDAEADSDETANP